MPEGCIRLARLLAIAAPILASFAAWLPTAFVRSGSYTCPRPASSRVCTNSTAGLRTSRRLE